MPIPIVELVIWGADKKAIDQWKTPTSGAPIDVDEVQLFDPTANNEVGAWSRGLYWTLIILMPTSSIYLVKGSGLML